MSVQRPSARFLTGLLLWLAMLAAPSMADDDIGQGPFAVGLRVFRIEVAAGIPAISVSVWYPAASSTQASGQAGVDAPAATSGPFPLVVLIHGLGGTGDMLGPVGRYLAAHGLVAASADYDTGPLDAGNSPQDRQMIWLLYDRPAIAARVMGFVDALNAPEGKLAGVIDTSHIGVWGHSTGGTTAFQAAGAQIDLRALDDWCFTYRTDSYADETCQFEGHERAIASRYGAADPFAALLPPMSDKRVSAVVAVSPGGELHAFGKQGIAAVKVPTLVMFATDDKEVSPQFNALWAYEGIGSKDKAMAEFDQGGHSLFMNPSDPHFHEATALATAFFLAMLKGNSSERAMLSSDAMSIPGAKYKSTLN